MALDRTEKILTGVVLSGSFLLLLTGVVNARQRKGQKARAWNGKGLPLREADSIYHELTGSYEAPHVEKGVVYVTGANLVVLALAVGLLESAGANYEHVPVEGSGVPKDWGAFARAVGTGIGLEEAPGLLFWIEDDDENLRVWSDANLKQEDIPRALASAAARTKEPVAA